MKKLVKNLTLCAVMIFAMSFSVFSATKSEKASSLKLRNETVIKVEKDSNGKIKSIQSPNGEKVELKNTQSIFNAAKAKCLVTATAVDGCTDAKVLAGLAVAAAALACATTGPAGCALASAAAIYAVKMMKDACGGGGGSKMDPCTELIAENRKFLVKENKS